MWEWGKEWTRGCDCDNIFYEQRTSAITHSGKPLLPTGQPLIQTQVFRVQTRPRCSDPEGEGKCSRGVGELLRDGEYTPPPGLEHHPAIGRAKRVLAKKVFSEDADV